MFYRPSNYSAYGRHSLFTTLEIEEIVESECTEDPEEIVVDETLETEEIVEDPDAMLLLWSDEAVEVSSELDKIVETLPL